MVQLCDVHRTVFVYTMIPKHPIRPCYVHNVTTFLFISNEQKNRNMFHLVTIIVTHMNKILCDKWRMIPHESSTLITVLNILGNDIPQIRPVKCIEKGVYHNL